MTHSPTIRYIDHADDLTEAQLAGGFFEGWPSHPTPADHLRILRGSAHCWCAMHDDSCVGFINALTDGVFYSFVPLLEVLPSYRRQGIGAELVRRVLVTLGDMYAIDLVCDDTMVPFYESLDFPKCNALVRRNFTRQCPSA